MTELEIRHAVLNNLTKVPEAERRCFFYLRDPNASFIKELPEAQRADYVAEGGEAQSKLTRLKQEIRGSRVPVRDYKNLTQFAHQVRDDLRRVILVDAPEKPTIDANPIGSESAPHLNVASHRAIAYVRTDGNMQRLQGYAYGQDGSSSSSNGLVVCGESGIGKSSLLANFYLQEKKRFEQEFPEFYAMTEEEKRRDIRMDYPPLFIMHFIGASPQSATAINIVRRVMSMMRQHFGLLMSVPDRDDDAMRGTTFL